MSLERLHEHRAVWDAKPVLRDIYAVWFDRLLEATEGARRVVEVGAGPGFLAEHSRRRRHGSLWVATDLLPTGWNDVAADALRLPFRDAAADAVVGLDVLHHLAEPRRFFEEAARILEPGGVLALVEPWVTPLSYPVYRLLHREGCDLRLDPWKPFGEDPKHKQAFEGNAAVAWRILRTSPASLWRELGFEPPRLEAMNGFGYLLSLGFFRWSLLPRALAGPLLALDRGLESAAPWLGMRVLAVWQRASPASTAAIRARA